MASISPVISGLMIFGMLCSYLNEYIFNQEIQDSLLNIYFPMFKEFQIEKNWKHQVVAISLKGKVLDVSK